MIRFRAWAEKHPFLLWLMTDSVSAGFGLAVVVPLWGWPPPGAWVVPAALSAARFLKAVGSVWAARLTYAGALAAPLAWGLFLLAASKGAGTSAFFLLVLWAALTVNAIGYALKSEKHGIEAMGKAAVWAFGSPLLILPLHYVWHRFG